MNFNNQISLFIELTLLLSSTFASDSDYVSIKVHNYTIRSQMADGGCTEDIDIYLITKCGSGADASATKNSDSCSATLDNTYVYTTDECDASSDSFEFVWSANNDCNGNFEAWIIGTCAQDYQWAETGSMDVSAYECGWNGPYIKSAVGTDDQVAYSLYKPCTPTSEPTPSPTASAASMTFTICIDSDYAVATTDDADKIQVRLWTDDDSYSPSEWRYLTSDSTLFSSSGSCHTFSTFNDIYAQWYLMDFSICSTDGVGITRILYWDMETESQQMVSSFDGDSECIKINGDFIMLDGDSSEGSHTHSSDTACQRLSVNLSYYRSGTQTVNEADVVDQTETDQFDDATDDCTSL